MTLATFAIIFSAVALASSIATLVYAVRIRKFIANTEMRIKHGYAAVVQEAEHIKQLFQTGLINVEKREQLFANLRTRLFGLEKKPEQK